MAIGKSERQPGRLFTLADENLLIGIGHLVVGRNHRFASSNASGFQPPVAIIFHLASRLQQVNGIWAAWKPDPSPRDRPASIDSALRFATKVVVATNLR
jgi:hypothetical protein